MLKTELNLRSLLFIQTKAEDKQHSGDFATLQCFDSYTLLISRKDVTELHFHLERRHKVHIWLYGIRTGIVIFICVLNRFYPICVY